MRTADRDHTVELFRAFEAEELESRLQNGSSYGDYYNGCCGFFLGRQ